MRLPPLADPGQRLRGTMVSRPEMGEAISRWLAKYGQRPEAPLQGAEARCFGALALDPDGANTRYHLLNGRRAPGTEAVARSQLAAIGPAAYRGYQKSDDCGLGLFDAVCKGFFRQEAAAGYADHRPFLAEAVLKLEHAAI